MHTDITKAENDLRTAEAELAKAQARVDDLTAVARLLDDTEAQRVQLTPEQVEAFEAATRLPEPQRVDALLTLLVPLA